MDLDMKAEKQLLLKDLCSRLPYGPIIRVSDWTPLDTELKVGHISRLMDEDLKIKPYLRRMSSMTEEEFVYFMGMKGRIIQSHEIQNMMKEVFNMPRSIGIGITLGRYSDKIDWLNARHFDYRYLIEKDLAIEVTEDNNPYKS